MRNCLSTRVSLESPIFNQKSVFADGVKDEALLGMDFLEVNKCVVDIAMYRGTGNFY